MIEQIIHLLSVEYLFNRSLGPFQSNLAYIFVGFNVLLILIAIISRRLVKNKDLFARKSAKKYGTLAWSMGSIGIVLYIFRQINVFYLSAPIIVLIWAIVFVIWLMLVLKYLFFVAPKRRKDLMQETGKREYLP